MDTPEATANDNDFSDFYPTYTSLFGDTLPDILQTRFEVSGELSPEFLRLFEQMRVKAFFSEILDEKTTQLLVFALFLAQGRNAAQLHARAARRAGASWQELHKVMELTAITSGFNALTLGDVIIKELRDKENSESRETPVR